LAVPVAEADPVIGQTVVETNTVSVVRKVVLAEAGQFGTVDGHALTVAVRVEKTAEVVYCSDCPEEPVGTGSSVAVAVACALGPVAVTGQFLVETEIVSVVT
jgi:hypothetical protein